MPQTQAQRYTLRASAAVTSATTQVGEWFDVGPYNELTTWLDVTAFASRVDETLVVTIERKADNTQGYVTVQTFSTVNTTGAQSQEQNTNSLIGGFIRYRAVTAGTWSSKSITYSVKCFAKFV